MDSEINQNKFMIYIDDDPIMHVSFKRVLNRYGFEIETYENADKGIARIHQRNPDLLIVDLKMPKTDGLSVIKKVHKINPDIVIVVTTGYATIGTAVTAIKTGAYDFLPKPFTPDELRLIIFRGLERSELVQQKRILEKEKEKMERQFISVVAHQLQSPLVAVHQYLDVLNHLEDNALSKECFKKWIDRSMKRIAEMQSLVKDWLTMSKIESGQLVENVTPVSIPPLVNEILEIFENCLIQRNIEINSELPEDLTPVKANAECLHIIFVNLISNAIKYNRENGFITISSRENDDAIKISVTDSGIGIPPEQLPVIFQEFHRVKTDSTRNIPGSGLGLSICKKIVTELGGKIELSSTLNQGTMVTITLPKTQ